MKMGLIDADKLASKMDKIAEAHDSCYCEYDEGVADTWSNAAELVRETPTVDAKPVKYGHWEHIEGTYDSYTCSCCGAKQGRLTYTNHEYCGACGAKMDDWKSVIK